MSYGIRRNKAGIHIGSAATAKIGLWGVTPVIKQASSSQAVAAYTHNASITNPVTGTEGQALNDGLVTVVRLVNQLRADLIAAGIIKGAA